MTLERKELFMTLHHTGDLAYYTDAYMHDLPLPDLPTKRRSLNLATWSLMIAELLRSSAQQFSSLPARTVTTVPSCTGPRYTTLKGRGGRGGVTHEKEEKEGELDMRRKGR